jgi:hypothetical protein
LYTTNFCSSVEWSDHATVTVRAEASSEYNPGDAGPDGALNTPLVGAATPIGYGTLAADADGAPARLISSPALTRPAAESARILANEERATTDLRSDLDSSLNI